jgi:hypothetical protein
MMGQQAAKVLVVLLTAMLFKSGACLDEIAAALDSKMKLVVLRCEDPLRVDKKEMWPVPRKLREAADKTPMQKYMLKRQPVVAFLTVENSIPTPGNTILTLPSAMDTFLGVLGTALETEQGPSDSVPANGGGISGSGVAAPVDEAELPGGAALVNQDSGGSDGSGGGGGGAESGESGGGGGESGESGESGGGESGGGGGGESSGGGGGESGSGDVSSAGGLASFLQELKFTAEQIAEYVPALATAGYDLVEDLEDMTAEELVKELGLKAGHAKRIVKGLKTGHLSQ